MVTQLFLFSSFILFLQTGKKIWHFACSLPNLFLFIHLCVRTYAGRNIEERVLLRKIKLATWGLALLRLLRRLFYTVCCSLSKFLRKIKFTANAICRISSIAYIQRFVPMGLFLFFTGLYVHALKTNDIKLKGILEGSVISLCHLLLYYLFNMPLQYLREDTELKIKNARAKIQLVSKTVAKHFGQYSSYGLGNNALYLWSLELSDETFFGNMFKISIPYYIGFNIALYVFASFLEITDYTNNSIAATILIFHFSSIVLLWKHVFCMKKLLRTQSNVLYLKNLLGVLIGLRCSYLQNIN